METSTEEIINGQVEMIENPQPQAQEKECIENSI